MLNVKFKKASDKMEQEHAQAQIKAQASTV